MSNMMKTGGNLPANPQSLTSLASVAAESAGAGGDALLRLLREGVWVIGAENDEPDEESVWAINPYSFEHGFIAWADSKVEGEVMVPHSQALPSRTELPDTSEGWDDQLAFRVLCVDGPDKGTEALYKTTSVGGKRAIGNIAKAIAAEASSGSDKVVPLVTLGTDSYQHKKYGKIYTPIFDIEKWVTMDGLEDVAADEPEAEPETKPARRRRRAK